MIGLIIGKEIFQNNSHLLQPSISAASYKEGESCVGDRAFVFTFMACAGRGGGPGTFRRRYLTSVYRHLVKKATETVPGFFSRKRGLPGPSVQITAQAGES